MVKNTGKELDYIEDYIKNEIKEFYSRFFREVLHKRAYEEPTDYQRFLRDPSDVISDKWFGGLKINRDYVAYAMDGKSGSYMIKTKRIPFESYYRKKYFCEVISGWNFNRKNILEFTPLLKGMEYSEMLKTDLTKANVLDGILKHVFHRSFGVKLDALFRTIIEDESNSYDLNFYINVNEKFRVTAEYDYNL